MKTPNNSKNHDRDKNPEGSPITVTVKDGKFLIADGNHRIVAAQEVGIVVDEDRDLPTG